MSIKSLINDEPQSLEIKSNLALKQMENIQKYSGESHCMSLIAVSCMDPLHKGLELDIKFGSNLAMNDFVEQVIGIWNVYKHMPNFIRSFKKEGKYVDELDGQPLQSNVEFPGSVEHYKGKKVIIDIIYENSTYTFKLYIYNEPYPRLLKVSINQNA